MSDTINSYKYNVANKFNKIVNDWIKIVSVYYKNDKDIRFVRDNIESYFHIDHFRVIEEATPFILMFGNEIQSSTIKNNILLTLDYSAHFKNVKNPNQIAKIINMIKEIWPNFNSVEKKTILSQIKDSLILCSCYTYVVNNNQIPPEQ